MSMTTNHEHLREVAEKATPIYTDLLGDRYFNDDYSHATLNVQQDDFIRAFSPETAIALLDELVALRKENERLREGIEQIANNIGESLNAGCDQDAVNRIGIYVSELFEMTAIDAARAAIGDSHE